MKISLALRLNVLIPMEKSIKGEILNFLKEKSKKKYYGHGYTEKQKCYLVYVKDNYPIETKLAQL